MAYGQTASVTSPNNVPNNRNFYKNNMNSMEITDNLSIHSGTGSAMGDNRGKRDNLVGLRTTGSNRYQEEYCGVTLRNF